MTDEQLAEQLENNAAAMLAAARALRERAARGIVPRQRRSTALRAPTLPDVPVSELDVAAARAVLARKGVVRR